MSRRSRQLAKGASQRFQQRRVLVELESGGTHTRTVQKPPTKEQLEQFKQEKQRYAKVRKR